MAIGDGIRRNVAKISQEERRRLMWALVTMDRTKLYPDLVTYWDKQNQIHQATHVHGGPAFLPWHRELCNRFEALIREVDPDLSLHYWDWTTDPRASPDGRGGVVNLFTNDFMGSSSGDAGYPFQDFETTEGAGHTRIWRSVTTPWMTVSSDQALSTSGDSLSQNQQFPTMRMDLETAHNAVHFSGIGGTIAASHFSFHDPFVFLLHSNVDRLFALWQRNAAYRQDPNQVYGSEGSSTSINEAIEPWAGASNLRPWAPPENQQVTKTCKDSSVVATPNYDTWSGSQSDWRYCSKCKGLNFGAGAVPCPAGGNHDNSGSQNYVLLHETASALGTDNWRWCNKCYCLNLALGTSGACAAGGTHALGSSGNYRLALTVYTGPEENTFSWCSKCGQLCYGGGGGAPCPAGGLHATATGIYTLARVSTRFPVGAAYGQSAWKLCTKCFGLGYSAGPPGMCSGGGSHNYALNEYVLAYAPMASPGQNNWRWCNKCQILHYGGNPPGPCPAGGTHFGGASGDYILPHSISTYGQETAWRRCSSCTSLVRIGNGLLPGANGRCPATGGGHSAPGPNSHNYRLDYA